MKSRISVMKGYCAAFTQVSTRKTLEINAPAELVSLLDGSHKAKLVQLKITVHGGNVEDIRAGIMLLEGGRWAIVLERRSKTYRNLLSIDIDAIVEVENTAEAEKALKALEAIEGLEDI